MFFWKRKKRIKVIGKLVDFELIDNKHYPIFSFTTIDGRVYERIRNIPKVDGILEASLEDVYIKQAVEEFLQKQLPINNVPIKYKEEDPTDFIAQWI